MKEESDDEAVHGIRTSKFWPGSSSSRKRPRRNSDATAKEEGSDDETLPTLVDGKALAQENGMKDDMKAAARKAGVKRAKSTSPTKKFKREYAPPEAYAHLECLSDYLQEHLDGTPHSLVPLTTTN